MNEVQLVEKGLTEEEAKILSKWIEDGKPGVSKYKAERLGEIYCLGYSCREITRWFPEFPLEIVLWSRVYYKWDELRDQYRTQVQKEIIQSALSTRLDAIRFLSEVISASHTKWRKEILSYLADPDKQEKPPKILPDNIYNYSQIVNQLKELLEPAQGKKGEEISSSPLVSVTVNSETKKPDIVVQNTSPEDIKRALYEDLNGVKKDGK
jgi:hypothetical protein